MLYYLGFPSGSDGKKSTCNAGDLGLIPGLERSPGEGNGYPLQYTGLENSMDCIVHGVPKSRDTTERLALFFFFGNRTEIGFPASFAVRCGRRTDFFLGNPGISNGCNSRPAL